MAVEEETSAGKETDRSIQLILVFVYKDLGRSADTMLIRNSECIGFVCYQDQRVEDKHCLLELIP